MLCRWKSIILCIVCFSFLAATPVRAQSAWSGTGASDQDDPAIWIHPTDQTKSVIYGSDKVANKIFVYSPAGSLLQTIVAPGQPGNIDVRYNVPVAGVTSDIVGVNRRDGTWRILLYNINPTDGTLTRIDNDAITTRQNYGFCFYKSPVSGKLYGITTSDAGNIEQFEISLTTGVSVTSVRSWSIGKSEGCVADDESQTLFINEEGGGVLKYGAEPTAPTTKTFIAPVGQNGLAADVEGATIYKTSATDGYVIVSSQGSDDFKVFNRVAPHAYVTSFTTGTSSTDGIDVTNMNIGSSYTQGLFISHNGGSAATLKPAAWNIIATGTSPQLTVSTSYNPRGAIGTLPTPTGQPSATPPLPTLTGGIVPTIPATCSTKARGDADCDNEIRLADYDLWRREFYGELTSLYADFNADNRVSLVDFELWRRSYTAVQHTTP